MNSFERKAGLVPAALLTGALALGLASASAAYADENPHDTIASTTISSSHFEGIAFESPDYQGKSNLKEYWDSVQNYRTEISALEESLAAYDLAEEEQAEIALLVSTAQEGTNLEELETIKAQLTESLEAKEAAALEAQRAAEAISSGNYIYPSGDVLTRSGGVNYFNGRRETWYSQRVLPGGGLNIPGRHVAEDGTIRDADNYIVVAASDLAYGTIIETSLGTAKVYDTGCAPGTTDVYVDW